MDDRDREPQVDLAKDASTYAAQLGSLVAAAAIAPLPVAWRARLEDRFRIPVGDAAAPSAMAQLLIFLGCGTFGFYHYMQGLLGGLTERAHAAAAHGRGEEVQMIGSAGIWMNPLLPFIFVFTTPVGFTCALFAMGGLVRTLYTAAHGGNLPDPTLAAIEWMRCKLLRRARATERELAKGEVTPDRIYFGDGQGAWDVRIVSREEYPWREGVGVVAAGHPHRLVARSELRDEAGRLRIAYDLRRLTEAEVLRGVRHYAPAQPPEYPKA